MSLSPEMPQASRLTECGLWGAAGLLILAAHVGAVAYLLPENAVSAAENSPPPAIMIELAAEPEAVETEDDQITPDQALSPEIKSNTAEPVEQPVEEPVPEEIPEPVVEPPEEIVPEEPVEEVTETIPEPVEEIEEIQEIDPIEEQALAALENVEVPIPVVRPPPPVEKKVEEKKEPPKKVVRKPEPKKPAPAAKASEQAQARVKQSDRTAASQAASGSNSSSMTPARWHTRVRAHIERRKRYPTKAQLQNSSGRVTVVFGVDDSGNVFSISLKKSSGSEALDEAVLTMVKRSSPVPPPPVGASKKDKNIDLEFNFIMR